jgi:hypothetical protein
MAGCDGDAKIAKSAAGESCDNTSDCNDGLKCYDGVCAKSSSGSGNSAGAPNGAAGAPDVVPETPPNLGKVGESCSKRADCEDGLACLSQRCSEDAATGAGGGGSGGPALGGLGETCGLTSDCADGLFCLPYNGNVQVLAVGSNSVGVCSPVNSGLEPTGKACGAECVTAADCCELPYELHAALAANSCTELANLLDGVNCATATVGLAAQRCFAQAAYCDCGKNTWACNDGACSYTAACSKATFNTPEGCPTYTRSGRALATPCDTTGSKKCEPPVADTICKTDANCDGEYVADRAPEVCGAGECTCYKETGTCYRKCTEDLDCPANYTCNTKTTVCEAEAGCTSDAECVVKSNDIRAKCFDGTCDVGCENDRDCNYGALTNYTSTKVCNAEKRCEAIGCSSDAECGATTYGLRIFCADKPAAVTATGISSAITD